jgi:hypothetical protein
MRYLVNRETKEHILDTGTAPMHGYWRRIEADSEGWIKHTGTVCPLPGDCMTYIREDKHQWVSESARKAGFWNWRYVTHYRPILEQAEPIPAPQYDPRSVSFNLMDRLKAAHEAAQQIPDLEAELREVLWSMGYDLVSRSPFVDDSDHPPAQPQVPDGFVIVERSALSEVLRISDREHPAWESCRSAMLTASGKGE